MDRARTDEIVGFIPGMIFQDAVQIRNMLEVVGVNFAARQRGVRQDVVLERFNLQIDPLFRQNRFGLFENFSVRYVGCAHGQRVCPGGEAQGT